MRKEVPDTRAERLLELSQEVVRIAGSLAQLSTGPARPLGQPCPATNSNEPDLPAETVRWLIGARRDRARYLPADLFIEPAWDMLLELLHGELANRPVPVSRLCAASGVPRSPALRWLESLEQRCAVVRKSAPQDTLVELSPETSKRLRRYIRDVVEARQAGER